MPLLGALLQTLFGGLASWLAQFFTRKVAVATAYVASFGVIVAALITAMQAIVLPLAAALFSTPLGQWIGLAFPPVAGTCITAVGATWAATTLYAWQRDALRLAASA